MTDIRQIKLIDLIPPNLQNDEKVKSAAEALDREFKKVTNLIPTLMIMHHIDDLEEPWIDDLAWQFHVDFYDPDLPIQQKRALVKNSLAWHKRKGTPSAVKELVSTVFGSGEVQEWFEYGGKPGYFRVMTSDESATNERANEFLVAIDSVKNMRSWLDGIIISTHAEMPLYFGGIIRTGDVLTIGAN